ncbi:MAG: helix-turn-helix transcriptional regulator [Solirubrobacterales bacterium]
MTPPEPSAAEEFGCRVFKARRRLGVSQEILAIFAGLHRQEVGLIERGKREPKLTTILKLTQALGVEPNELLLGINPHKLRRPAE